MELQDLCWGREWWEDDRRRQNDHSLEREYSRVATYLGCSQPRFIVQYHICPLNPARKIFKPWTRSQPWVPLCVWSQTKNKNGQPCGFKAVIHMLWHVQSRKFNPSSTWSLESCQVFFQWHMTTTISDSDCSSSVKRTLKLKLQEWTLLEET